MAGADLATVEIESFIVCGQLILHGSGKSDKNENRCQKHCVAA
jgi:hypothetical protein